MRPVVILLLGAVLAGAGYGAAKLWRSSQDGPCADAPVVAARDVTASRATPVTGRELTGVRAGQPDAVRRTFLPATAADTGTGAGQVRVTVVVSTDAAVDGDALARRYGLTDAGSAPGAVGTGTGRYATARGSAVAVGALDACTGVVVAGRRASAVQRAAERLQAP